MGMKKIAQRMLERSYTVGRPPRRFTPNQVDQSSLMTVYWAVIMLVLSSVLAVAFFSWAFLSSPMDEAFAASENKQARVCDTYALIFCAVLVVVVCFCGASLI